MLDTKVVSTLLFKFLDLGAAEKVLMPHADKLRQDAAFNDRFCGLDFFLSDRVITFERAIDCFGAAQ